MDVHLARVDRPWSLNTWYDVKMWGSTDKFRVEANGTVLTATETNDYTGSISFSTWDSGNDVLISNIAVGKYTPNEPIQSMYAASTATVYDSDSISTVDNQSYNMSIARNNSIIYPDQNLTRNSSAVDI